MVPQTALATLLCRDCGEEKEVNSFYYLRQSRKHSSVCKECTRFNSAMYQHKKRYVGDGFTLNQWKALCAQYGNRCLNCGDTDAELCIDHIKHFSDGGTNSINNIQPLCRRCNSKKWKQTVDCRSGEPIISKRDKVALLRKMDLGEAVAIIAARVRDDVQGTRGRD